MTAPKVSLVAVTFRGPRLRELALPEPAAKRDIGIKCAFTIMREMARKFRAFLECREPDGSTKFYKTEKVLASPELQSRCIEKQVLAKIVRRITAKDPVPPKRLN